MGFSIGSFLKTIAGPVIGGLIGGPVGALAGGAITAGFAPAPRRPSFPGPTATPALAKIPQVIGGAILTVAALLQLSRQNTGQPVSARKIRDAARVCGIDTAASMFGLSSTQICQIIISRPRQRGRGISASDLRRTRSTIRKISTMQHNLAHLVSHSKGRHRGAGGKFI